MSILRRWRFFGARWGDPSEADVPIAPAYEVPALYPDGIVRWRAQEAAGSVDPSAVSALAGLVAFKANLWSPRFIGTPTIDGVPIATTDDLTAGSVDPAEIAGLRGWLASKASLLSPIFLGTPKVPTASPSTNSTVAASTAYVDAAVAAGSSTGSVDPSAIAGLQGLDAAKAPLLSPTFLGTPKVPTAAPLTSSTVAASTGYVDAAVTAGATEAGAPPSDVSGLAGLVASKAPLLSPQFIGTPRANALPLATQAYVDAAITAVSYDSAQAILASQIFGA